MSHDSAPQPPRWADRFFGWYCRNELAESVMGDLHERYEDYRLHHKKGYADAKYWLDVLRFINRHTLKRKTQNRRILINTIMFKNFALVAFRNILRNRAFTAINVLGLAVAMSVCLIIITMINDQLGYDQFHTQRDEIYRVIHRRSTGVDLAIATTPLPLEAKVRSDYPGIKQLVPFRRGLDGEILDNGKAIPINGLFTNPEFFELFDFELSLGNPKTALLDPYSIVITTEVAEKFFRNQDPMGQTLTIGEKGQFTVTGVFAELPGKTHIEFEALGSYTTVPILENQEKLPKHLDSWENASSGWLYFTLQDGQRRGDFQVFLDGLTKEFYNESSEFVATFRIQKMTDITPGPLMGNQIGQAMPNFFVYGLIVLAVLIMICATLNYANLSTARALTRFKEVGIRKIMGSSRSQVILQFVLEAIIVSVISLALAIGLLRLLIPAFEQLTLSSILGWQLVPDMKVYIQFFLFSLLTGLLTGFFPALYMASVKILSALKGVNVPKMSKIGLRKSLIVVQLVITIVLIISSSLVYRQIHFMMNKDYGFHKDNIVNIDLQGQDFDLLKAELDRLSFVQQVSGANNIPSVGQHNDLKIRRLQSDDPQDFYYFSVDQNYIDNLQLKQVAGTNFIPSEKGIQQIMLNETALKEIGYADAMSAIGENVILEDSTQAKVVGVVQDYNFMMLYMDIKPLVLRYHPEEFEWAQVRISGSNPLDELEQLEALWAGFDPNHDLEYQFFDEQIEEFYSTFFDIVYIVGLVSVLSFVIASMGLLGITSYAMRSRLKEVSIRKVLGARGKDIVLMLGKGFVVMITGATLIGGLLSYFGNKLWLDMFAYRIDFGLDVVGIAFLFIAVITGLTVGIQAIRAVGTNPADVLRTE